MRLACVRIFNLLIVVSSFQCVAARLTIPLLESQNVVYVFAEVGFVENKDLNYDFKKAVSVSERFISEARVDGANLSLYYASYDGSRQRYDDGGFPIKKSGFKKIKNIVYRSPWVWGEYMSIPVVYSVGKGSFPFREDYVFGENGCFKAYVDFGQIYEKAYEKYMSKHVDAKWVSSNSDSFFGLDRPFVFYQPSPMKDIQDFKGQLGDGMKFGIGLSKIGSKLCFSCDHQKYEDRDEEKILKNVVSFIGKYRSADKGKVDDVKAILDSHSVDVDFGMAMPTVSWSSGKPKLLHTDYKGYLREWRYYSDGFFEGYMKDGDFVYLLLSRYQDSVEEEDGKSSFQIFVLQRSGGEYFLDPNTSDDLESRALVFDDLFLELLTRSIFKSEKAVKND